MSWRRDGLVWGVIALIACARTPEGPRQPGGGAATKTLGSIAVKVPLAWQEVAPASAMRRAEWRLPGSRLAADGHLVVYYFGRRGAGDVEANLERWTSQIEQADGSSSRDAALVARYKVGGLEVISVDVAGRYVAPVRPGAAERHQKDGQRMLAAIVLAPDGPYYFKLLGPWATVEGHKTRFLALLGSLTLAR